jgi:hypothetical protein
MQAKLYQMRPADYDMIAEQLHEVNQAYELNTYESKTEVVEVMRKKYGDAEAAKMLKAYQRRNTGPKRVVIDDRPELMQMITKTAEQEGQDLGGEQMSDEDFD